MFGVALIGNQIVDPIFFDKNLNGNRYFALIVTDFPVLLENLSLQLRLNMWFQQYAYPSHTLRLLVRH